MSIYAFILFLFIFAVIIGVLYKDIIYYLFTFLYTLLIPFSFQMILIERDLPLQGKNMAAAVLIPCFLAMVLLGFLNTKEKNGKPNNIIALYFPVFLPMLYFASFSEIYILVYHFFPVFFSFFEEITLGMLTCNLFGIIMLVDIPGMNF